MSDLIILGLPPSSYVRTARLICANKGVEHTLQPVDFRSEAYKADHHPFARMPALQHGDLRLYECLAIGTYVDGAFEGPALQPDDALARARMMQWISVVNDYVYDQIVGCCVSERFVKPMRGLEPDEAKIAAAVPKIEEALDVVAAEVAGQDYLVGDTVTLADLFLAPVMHYLAATPEGEQLLPSRSAIGDWMERMGETPGFAEINKLGP